MNIYRCDNCKAEVQDVDVKRGWVEVTSMDEMLAFGDDDSDKHFCSYRCLGLFAFAMTGDG